MVENLDLTDNSEAKGSESYLTDDDCYLEQWEQLDDAEYFNRPPQIDTISGQVCDEGPSSSGEQITRAHNLIDGIDNSNDDASNSNLVLSELPKIVHKK